MQERGRVENVKRRSRHLLTPPVDYPSRPSCAVLGMDRRGAAQITEPHIQKLVTVKNNFKELVIEILSLC